MTQYNNGNPSTERKVEGVAETLEAFSALVHEHAATTRGATIIVANAEKQLHTLQLGADITAMPDPTHCITIQRVIRPR